jgi:hypothetical protein
MKFVSARNMPQGPTLASAGVLRSVTRRLDTQPRVKGAIVTLGENFTTEAGPGPRCRRADARRKHQGPNAKLQRISNAETNSQH